MLVPKGSDENRRHWQSSPFRLGAHGRFRAAGIDDDTGTIAKRIVKTPFVQGLLTRMGVFGELDWDQVVKENHSLALTLAQPLPSLLIRKPGVC